MSCGRFSSNILSRIEEVEGVARGVEGLGRMPWRGGD